MGVHYDPNDFWIETFAADAVDVTWATNAPAGGACTVTGGALDYDVPNGDLATGSTAHNLGLAVDFAIVCTTVDGKMSSASLPLSLTSSAFSHQSAIPAQYTCDGGNISPPLAWGRIPSGTQSLALIVDDPDAPGGAWAHWVLYNLPTSASGLIEDVSSLPAGTLEGLNDWNATGYGGPCPPSDGPHRYFHKLYALDVTLPDLSQPTKAELELAMRGHILEATELIGTYQR
jgi:Raf kinase inhibitor-like YbhB/YbcL family protein